MGRLKNKKANPTFTRPTIDLGNSGVREWKDVKVVELAEGDIIAQSGTVKLIMQTCGEEYYIQAGQDNELFLGPETTVLAFVRKDN